MPRLKFLTDSLSRFADETWAYVPSQNSTWEISIGNTYNIYTIDIYIYIYILYYIYSSIFLWGS